MDISKEATLKARIYFIILNVHLQSALAYAMCVEAMLTQASNMYKLIMMD